MSKGEKYMTGYCPVCVRPYPDCKCATWVGLTRMELIKCGVFPWGMSYKLYEAIEAKLKEKNT